LICSAEIVRGIGLQLGMNVVSKNEFTADVDTNLKLKAEMAKVILEKHDFVIVHINGADEAAHRKNFIEKAEFIQKIDNELFGALGKEIDYKLIMTSDHGTSSITGKHMNCSVKWYEN